MTSMRIILTYANHHNYKIMSFDIKTTFLHAKLGYLLYVKQIPGFPEADPLTVLRLLVALYGLHQSAYEFYNFLLKLLIRLGLSCSEMDHSIFIGHWISPPTPPFPCHCPANHLSSSFQSTSMMASLFPTPHPYMAGSSIN